MNHSWPGRYRFDNGGLIKGFRIQTKLSPRKRKISVSRLNDILCRQEYPRVETDVHLNIVIIKISSAIMFFAYLCRSQRKKFLHLAYGVSHAILRNNTYIYIYMSELNLIFCFFVFALSTK